MKFKFRLITTILFLCAIATASAQPKPQNVYSINDSSGRVLFFPTDNPPGRVVWKITTSLGDFCPEWFNYRISGKPGAYTITFSSTTSGDSMSGAINDQGTVVSIDDSNFMCALGGIDPDGQYQQGQAPSAQKITQKQMKDNKIIKK